MRLPAKVPQSIDIGEVEGPVFPATKIPAHLPAIPVGAINRCKVLKIIIVKLCFKPIIEVQLSIGGISQAEGAVDHPGTHVIRIIAGGINPGGSFIGAERTPGAPVGGVTVIVPVSVSIARASPNVPVVGEGALKIFGFNGLPAG